MATLLIDMPSGIAGDMLLAALIAVGAEPDAIAAGLTGLGIGPIRLSTLAVQVSGIAAVRLEVDAEQCTTDSVWPNATPAGKLHIRPVQAAAHAAVAVRRDADHGGDQLHRPYRRIRELIAVATLPERVRTRAQRVFRVLAEAEGAVHGMAVDDVLFHEVGGVDAIADVVGCCLALEQLAIDRVIAGPLLPGEGSVHCAHGRMPVPVPAVAAMLATFRAPHRRLGRETGELTTPTGCALVCALADAWLDDATPTLAIRAVGYGAGHKIFPDLANVVRVSIADAVAAPPHTDRVVELRCQLDDATGEQLAALVDELLAAGARDAWCTAITMKKGRPGIALAVLVDPADRERLATLVLARSPTIGVRWQVMDRLTLPRRSAEVIVDGQVIALKVVTLPDGSERAKPEADAVAAAARTLGRSFAAISDAALAAWRARPS